MRSLGFGAAKPAFQVDPGASSRAECHHRRCDTLRRVEGDALGHEFANDQREVGKSNAGMAGSLPPLVFSRAPPAGDHPVEVPC